MAKKNLASLMNGIIGPTEVKDEPRAVYESPTPKKEESQTLRGPGRPRKNEDETKEIRATIIVDSEVMKKLKYISLVEGKMIKTVLGEAFEAFLKDWTAKNGVINI